ncbi:HAD-IA family hydrolase [Lactococcus ileimucosae]|uniref:HAD-IA family hydrolase n=1 Tax=Lactococcus ileimucosae TaxID=2941329 RepID=A0ABV4D466_9LACT
MKKVIIFDLDGTLFDTSKGIFNSIRFAIEKMDISNLAEERFPEFVGPPPVKAYQEIAGLSEDKARQATQYHRGYGKSKGIYEAELYPNMYQLLSDLTEKGFRLGVATLKRQDIAQEVLEHFKISQFFDVVIGMDFEDTLTKTDTINIVLKSLGVNKSQALMIGDTKGDFQGANNAGVDFIAVTYGFGFNQDTDYSTFVKQPLGIANNTLELKEIISKLSP